MSESERDEARQDRERKEDELVREEAEAAAAEAGAIGGRSGTEDIDEAERPVIEAGGGEAEGFEQAEEELRDQAEHGEGRDPAADAGATESEQDPATYGEGDAVRSTQTEEDTEGGSPHG
jgi:hypothetical protein